MLKLITSGRVLLTNVVRTRARKYVWLQSPDGGWNGGKIPGAELWCTAAPQDESEVDYVKRLSEVHECLNKSHNLTIDDPDRPSLYFSVTVGKDVGVFYGWWVMMLSFSSHI
jgi:hypothetical protein